MNNGHFWAVYISNNVMPDFTLFRDIFKTKVLNAFAGIENEAEKMTEQRWQHRMEQQGDDEVDIADLAEDAQEVGLSFYLTARGIQQGISNLMAVGLHHLHEQQLLYIHRMELLTRSEQNKERLVNIDEAKKRFRAFGVDIDRFRLRDKVDELRLVANVVKHGDGKSAAALRLLRPDLFVPPGLAAYSGHPLPPRSQVFRPLIGEDLYVTESDLDSYFDAVEEFWYALGESMVKSVGSIDSGTDVTF